MTEILLLSIVGNITVGLALALLVGGVGGVYVARYMMRTSGKKWH